jgi:cell division protease FtsH
MKPKTNWLLILLVGTWLAVLALNALQGAVPETSYTDFKKAVAAGEVSEVVLSQTTIRARRKPKPGVPAGEWFAVVRISDDKLLGELETRGVKVTGVPEGSSWRDALPWLIPLGLMALAWSFTRRMARGQGGMMAIGRSKAKVYMEKEVKVTFDDAAGVDEAKEELREVVEFLRTPEKFGRLGGRIPKGILLVGPPGTGKTLLARAVAGEAGVPFFSISGSEFVEMFVGVGAARVRDLFLQAREKAPCIIFIDELDALGKARGMGPMAHEEREQTLNQLLVEMDGFDSRAGVVLMAATNRPEILDPALLRAGRFDRHILVDRPDKAGRLAILKLHARSVKLASDADLDVIAGMTPGFAGADLANIINEAALLAVRRNHEAVARDDLEEAVERVVAGLEKRNRVLNRAERERVAHHEVGHALVALAIPGADAVQKISIIPRGISALGYTLQLPTEDRFLMTQAELEAKIAVLMGGRVAEQLVFHDVSTGAQDDLQKATAIARAMVKSYGMSPRLRELSLEPPHTSLLPVEDPMRARGEYSEQIAREIDDEVQRILGEQRERAAGILGARMNAVREAAVVLLQKETITGTELAAIVAANPAQPDVRSVAS